MRFHVTAVREHVMVRIADGIAGSSEQLSDLPLLRAHRLDTTGGANATIRRSRFSFWRHRSA